MKKILIVLIAYCFSHLNAQVFTAELFKDKIYVLNGFGMELSVYNLNTQAYKRVSLKNISKNAVFDFFIHYDDFNIYLSDSNRDMIYSLDGNFVLKKSLDIKQKHGTQIYRKIFPSEYNELIISSKDKFEVFKLRNDRLKRIISAEREFKDIFADRDFIYLLYKDNISIYSHAGVYLKKIAVPDATSYTDLIVNDYRVFLKSDSIITSIGRNNKIFTDLEINNIAAFTAIDSTLYYISADSLKLIRTDL
jgi:hypothetical protein